MNDQTEIVDQEARLRALDPSASFIVQAPAGSGKTGLLTQRFLVLLSGVDAPEEVVAITFTRKAAAEMRQRILEALECAERDPAPEQGHAKHTWELARRALIRDQELGWQLLDNPARLRIQTIDSLCATLARQMPVLSQFGSVPTIAEDAEPLYLEAARNTIAELESSAGWSHAVAHLVQHLDNRLDKLQGLISTMLARRDQWLRHIADPNKRELERENLEAAMARILTGALADLAKQVPAACVSELIELARFGANNLESGVDSPIAVCADLLALPGVQVADRVAWEGLAQLLLTADGSWRKSLNKNQGFPPPGSTSDSEEKARFSEMKQRMMALLESFQGENALREQLALLRELPPHRYSDSEWQTLQALVKLLRVAAAHLELVFSERGQVDFPALAQAAVRALGESDAPTDLALALDYRIRHLLMDEFQDTSFNQYELLKRLTAGWQPGDGHSLFVVGDPMQSIYRFREAEVGLFLAARDHGIGQLPLEFLRLEVNFRSQQGIVDWINQQFPQVLPAYDEASSGAVSYAPSTAFHPPLQTDAVSVHPALVPPLRKRDDIAEADLIVSLVRQAKAAHPEGSTAILVRGRSHLLQIVQQLRQAGIKFQAVEIEGLAQRPVVQDLLALTRALSHVGDRIAWLALLRAPYCGMTLEDLHTLAGDDFNRTIHDLLHQQARLTRLSEDGRSRMARVLPVLDIALAEQLRCPLRSCIEAVWIALGGPACVSDETDLEDAEVFFQLLETLNNAGANAGDWPDIHDLDKRVEKLFALPDVEADGSLQLMTVHKAKGLEFDTVILPGLGRTPRQDDAKLLQWLERARESDNQDSGLSELLLAPINAQGEDRNPMAVYLQRLEKLKGSFEDGRLLYVAATRAKQRLHLLGQVGFQDKDGELALKEPAKNSLLARLWPVVKGDFESLLADATDQTSSPDNATEPTVPGRLRSRLALDWSPPDPAASIEVAGSTVEAGVGALIEFGWAGETARQVGTVVHRLLQHIGEIGIERFKPGDPDRFEQIARKMLARLGVPQDRLKPALVEIVSALKLALEDERGRWILSGLHQKARCELALSGQRDKGIDHLVIDRTFIDEQGTRWIIDYKTGAHSGGGVDEFLDREQERYRHQLEGYAGIMSKMEARPIRLGLYFPLLGGWREWPYLTR